MDPENTVDQDRRAIEPTWAEIVPGKRRRMSSRKPHVVLVMLLVASATGMYLSWAGAGLPLFVPVASWVAIVSLGTVLTGGSLWLAYAARTNGDDHPRWLSRRWVRFGHLAVGGSVVGLVVRQLGTGSTSTGGGSLLIVVAGLLFLCGAVSVIVGTERSTVNRRVTALSVVLAGLGIAGIAWADVAMDGGTISIVVVRAIHLVGVGAWIGGALWHNTLVLPAIDRGAIGEIRPVVRRFQRVVPLFIVALFATGTHQAITWLGTQPSTYLTTTVGRLIGLKVALLLVLTALVVLTRVRARTQRANDHPGPSRRCG